MSASDVLDMARDLKGQRQPYALVTVVRAIAPTSAYVGGQAIVLADGTLYGWIGGGCAREIVIDAAQAAIKAGVPRLVRISNDRLLLADDIEQHAMSCASNGTMEIFIHPYGAGSALCIQGSTPAADEARFFADHLGMRLVESVSQADVVLVATQGQGDESALEGALRSAAPHVLMISSRRKAQRLRELMRERGVTDSQLARLQAPAGHDVGAQTPAEIAMVAVSAVLGLMRQQNAKPTQAPEPITMPETATAAAGDGRFHNPVCGRDIDVSCPKHVEAYEGESYYFCCDGCWKTFMGDPGKYAVIHQNQRRS